MYREPEKVKAINEMSVPQNREELQRFLGMTKLCKFINLTYKERLASLNLPSLLYRRRRGDMIMTLKKIYFSN